MKILYGISLYKSEEMAEIGKKYLAKIPKKVEQIVSGSSSGCAVATAILFAASLEGRHMNHVFYYPEKAGCGHRGSEKRFSGIPRTCVYTAFVDDFVDSGKTAKSVISLAERIHGIEVKFVVVSRLPYVGISELKEIEKTGTIKVIEV